MKHLALVSCLLIAFASLGCGGTSDDTNGDVDGGTGGADGGTGGTDGGIDGGTGGTDGGTGGTNGGTGGTVGGDQCDYVGENTGAGWSGPPSCSATEILQGDPLTCTVQAVGGIDVGAIIVDRETPGFTQGKPEDKHGIRASNTAALALQDVRVDAVLRRHPRPPAIIPRTKKRSGS